MLHFANPYYLYVLIIVPILVFFFIILMIKKKSLLEKFGDLSVISKLMPLASKRRLAFKFFTLIISLSILIVAIARPQYGAKLKEVKTKGVEIIIALDVSNSMLAQDISPNRLEAAKRAIDKMLDNLNDDKIGLIVFAGSAFTQVPITTDYTATKMMLSSINPGMVQEQGTSIGDAIDLAMKSFSPDNTKKKALIIITDGENHQDNPVEMATKAKEKGINVYTIGIGNSKGSPIPIGKGSDFKKDRNGDVIITKLDENTLITIAKAGNGTYTRATNSVFGLMNLYEEIGKLDKSELESAIYSEYEDIFQYFVFLALLFLLVDFVVMNRKNKQLEKMKLFNLRS
jgi:Ca-activated chloride channel homolog